MQSCPDKITGPCTCPLKKGTPMAKAFASQGDLSEKTISTYRTRVLRKLGCSSNAEIVQHALNHDLLG